MDIPPLPSPLLVLQAGLSVFHLKVYVMGVNSVQCALNAEIKCIGDIVGVSKLNLCLQVDMAIT